jgi:hypothetical protein
MLFSFSWQQPVMFYFPVLDCSGSLKENSILHTREVGVDISDKGLYTFNTGGVTDPLIISVFHWWSIPISTRRLHLLHVQNWGTGVPKDRDEVKRWEPGWECQGWVWSRSYRSVINIKLDWSYTMLKSWRECSRLSIWGECRSIKPLYFQQFEKRREPRCLYT